MFFYFKLTRGIDMFICADFVAQGKTLHVTILVIEPGLVGIVMDAHRGIGWLV